MKQVFGLIGRTLSHSFSQKYFTEKFEKENIPDCTYNLYELKEIHEIIPLIKGNKDLCGLNVTIPYKQEVIQYLNEIDEHAKEIGAVNVISIKNGQLKGFNSDFLGFKNTLDKFLNPNRKIKALIFGTGGASKGIAYGLQQASIPYKYVSRSQKENSLTYSQLKDTPEILQEYNLLINTTPMGTFPDTDNCIDIPYQKITPDHFLYDLVYNPAETLFMKKGIEQGATVKNGYDMLVGQAEESWKTWNS